MSRVPLIAGPTAVGKSAVAVAIALKQSAEIVSCDSRQLYREMDVGTAKPTPNELAAVPHHFIDEATIEDPWSAGRFARAAEQRITEILGRGALPVVVGGSTLYIQALVDGLADIPPTDPAIRQALNDKLATVGSAVLYEALVRVDPDFASTLDATKSQRILRGLEVYASTGQPLSSFFANVPPPSHRYLVVVLDMDRERLYGRIDNRVDRMMENGLLAEVHALMQAGHDPGENPLRTIGYSELAPVIRGESELDDAVALIKRNSRRYAKRQLTWLRRRSDAVWITVNPEEDAEPVVERILSELKTPSETA
ncbi:MAG: tRNA (adenosine(37)-N6)-dimethylallyltransferase MiaA [Rhodothermales bacterium]|nr:tRNA (adenosine(37)-N6)-dimethylallyltransferase MiaA [Rhodothermales bacterium]